MIISHLAGSIRNALGWNDMTLILGSLCFLVGVVAVSKNASSPLILVSHSGCPSIVQSIILHNMKKYTSNPKLKTKSQSGLIFFSFEIKFYRFGILGVKSPDRASP